jgi:hypothetical protein
VVERRSLPFRLYEIVNDLVAGNRLAANRPAFVHDLKAVRTMAPILYPGKILNAAVNFYSHVNLCRRSSTATR